MKCFNHSIDAIGICKHCHRAICGECCTDLGHGLACKNLHETEVQEYQTLIDNSKQTYKSSPKSTLFAPIFSIFMGAIFVYYGYLRGVSDFILIIGIGFVVIGVITLVYNLKFLKKITTKYE